MRKIVGLVVLMACGASVSQAQVKVSHVPSDATAVLHLDLKELGQSPMGQFLQQSLDDNARRGLAWLQSTAGINLTNDVDSFVVYTRGKMQTTGVVQIAYGRFDVAKLTAAVGGTKAFQNKALGDRSLLSWSEGANRRHLCFLDPTMLVLTWDEAQILDVIARVDGTARAAEGEGPFAQVLSHKKGRFLAAQANGLAELGNANPQLQVLKQAEALRLEIGQLAEQNGVACTLAVKASSKEQGQQIQQAAQGIQALMMLQASQNQDVAALAQSSQVALQDEIVTVTLNLPESLMSKLIQMRVAQQHAAQEARRARQEARRKAAGDGAGAENGGAAGEKKLGRPAFDAQ